MNVAIYARYSTDQQDKTSIDGQVANCEALAQREALTVVGTFKDEGISGNDDTRPGYRRLLADLEAGKFDGIVVDETSRITRNQAELHRLVAELNFRDQFLITGDGVDTRSESSELLLSVKAAVDAMEGRKIGYRTYRSLRERHKAGHSAGGRIYGYTSESDGDYMRRVVEPEQGAIVREIFERYAAGDSAKTIARALNERGVPSPGSYWSNKRSTGWPHTTIIGCATKASGILRNPIYKGEVTWNKRHGKKRPGTGKRVQKRRPESEWVRVRDESLRIVSDALWNRVQKRMQAKVRNPDGGRKVGRPPKYLLTGLLKCGSCGGSYTVRNGRSYTCTNTANGRLCDQRGYIKREKVETELLSGVKEQLLAPAFVKKMAAAIRKRARAPKRDYKGEIAALDKQIANVVEGLVSAGSSKALTAKLRELETKRESLRSMSQAIPTAIMAGADEKWRKIVSNLEDLRKCAEPDEVERARELLRHIIGEVEIREEPAGTFAIVCVQTAGGYNSGAEKRT